MLIQIESGLSQIMGAQKMIKENQWSHGMRDFRVPSLTEEQSRYGCGFSRTTFDPQIGEETYVLFCENPPYAKALSSVQPLTLVAHKGVVRTPYGVVGYVVWQIAAGSNQESFVETFLNPFQFGTLKLISDAANQTHLKFMALDRSDQSVVSMIDFENTFELDHLLFHMVMNIGNADETDFSSATSFIMDNVEMKQLVEGAIG